MNFVAGVATGVVALALTQWGWKWCCRKMDNILPTWRE